jgi:hypothetical protein
MWLKHLPGTDFWPVAKARNRAFPAASRGRAEGCQAIAFS